MTKPTEKIMKRFSVDECVEILAHCALIESSIKSLRAKALTDLDFRMNQPKLKVIDGDKDD
jgi:hypothetical protein